MISLKGVMVSQVSVSEQGGEFGADRTIGQWTLGRLQMRDAPGDELELKGKQRPQGHWEFVVWWLVLSARLKCALPDLKAAFRPEKPKQDLIP